MDRSKTHGAPSWVGYSGKDPAAARKFYDKVLGWKAVDMPMADGSNYTAISVGDEMVGGFSPMPAEQSGWVVYVTVDDVDARFKKAVDAGAKTMMAPFDRLGVGRICQIVDPTGAVVAFIKSAA